MNSQAILGTALWARTIAKETCFEILDRFYERGGRQIDTATNYPINKNSDDFRKAEKILKEWIDVHEVSDLKVLVKVGSLNNMGGAENNMSKSFLLMMMDEYAFMFHSNFDILSVHWDNREDKNDIYSTFEAFQIAAQQGLQIGLSGIKHPNIYAEVNTDFNLNFHIQIKHNLLYSDYERYSTLHDCSNFMAYGINAGGLKINLEEYHEKSSLKARGGDTKNLHPIIESLNKIIINSNQNIVLPKIENFNQCGLIYALQNTDIQKVIIGTSKIEQLDITLNFIDTLQENNYQEVYKNLLKLTKH